MDQQVAIILTVGIFAYSIITIIKVITEFFLRRKLIDKAEASAGLSAAMEVAMRSLTPKFEQLRYPTLKWGLVFLFAGIGLISLEYLQFDQYNSPLPFGIISACIAFGFLIYYFLMKREIDKKPD